jgi:hypothetical protein
VRPVYVWAPLGIFLPSKQRLLGRPSPRLCRQGGSCMPHSCHQLRTCMRSMLVFPMCSFLKFYQHLAGLHKCSNLAQSTDWCHSYCRSCAQGAIRCLGWSTRVTEGASGSASNGAFQPTTLVQRPYAHAVHLDDTQMPVQATTHTVPAHLEDRGCEGFTARNPLLSNHLYTVRTGPSLSC